jgi:Bacterial Ig-like domain
MKTNFRSLLFGVLASSLFAGVLFACNGNVGPQSAPPDPTTPPPVTQPPPVPDPNKPPPVIDPTLPRIVWSTPEDGQKSVPLNSGIRLEFSLQMDPESVKVSISPNVDLTAGRWLAEDRFQELELRPPKGIQPETTYTLSVTGLSQTGKKLSSELRFTTGSGNDEAAPYLISSVPQNNQAAFSADITKMVFTFNEPVTVDLDQGMASLECDVRTGCGGFGNSSWSADHKTLMLEFRYGLRGPSKYRAEITARDVAGNLSAKATVQFQTAADQRPKLINFIPGQKEVVSLADQKLTLTFDKAMNKDSLKTALSGTVFFDRTISNLKVSSVSDGPVANSYTVNFVDLFGDGSRMNWYLGRPADLEGRTVAELYSGEFGILLRK